MQFKPGDRVRALVTFSSEQEGGVVAGRTYAVRSVDICGNLIFTHEREDVRDGWPMSCFELAPIKPGDMVTLKPMRVINIEASGQLQLHSFLSGVFYVTPEMIAEHHPSPGWKVGDKTDRGVIVYIHGARASVTNNNGELETFPLINLARPE